MNRNGLADQMPGITGAVHTLVHFMDGGGDGKFKVDVAQYTVGVFRHPGHLRLFLLA